MGGSNSTGVAAGKDESDVESQDPTMDASTPRTGQREAGQSRSLTNPFTPAPPTASNSRISSASASATKPVAPSIVAAKSTTVTAVKGAKTPSGDTAGSSTSMAASSTSSTSTAASSSSNSKLSSIRNFLPSRQPAPQEAVEESDDDTAEDSGLVGRMKNSFSKAKQRVQDAAEDAQVCPSLTFRQRIYGFTVFCSIGILLTVLSVLSWGNWTRYGVLFTLGNITSLCSTGFLVGPSRQMRSLFHEDRRTTSAIYIVSMLMTLVAAFWLHSGVLVFILVVVQYAAFIWYCLSYIPGARSVARKCCLAML